VKSRLALGMAVMIKLTKICYIEHSHARRRSVENETSARHVGKVTLESKVKLLVACMNGDYAP